MQVDILVHEIKKQFEDVIKCNAWLDDFVYYISLCKDIDLGLDEQEETLFFERALTCLAKWQVFNKYLPKHMADNFACMLKEIAKEIIALDKYEDDLQISELFCALNTIAEIAKILSYAKVWEDAKINIECFSIAHKDQANTS
mgnify:CR=1 FL=1